MKPASFNNSKTTRTFDFVICILENMGHFMQKEKELESHSVVSFNL